jgi:hypothetical protein
MFRASKPRRLHAIAAASLALVASSPLTGCLTCAMWKKLDDSKGERVAAAALTPVTVAVDVALFAGYAYVEACAKGGGGSCCRRGCR